MASFFLERCGDTMRAVECSPPAKKARGLENAVAQVDVVEQALSEESCSGCGVPGHTITNCPFVAEVTTKAKTVKWKSAEANAKQASPAQASALPSREQAQSRDQGQFALARAMGRADQQGAWQAQGQWQNFGKSKVDDKKWFKMDVCKFWKAGHCTHGKKCTFAHGEHEIGMSADALKASRGNSGNSLDNVDLSNMSLGDVARIAEESSQWLAQAALFMANATDTPATPSVVETATQAAERVAWASGIVLSYEPKTADEATLVQPIQIAVQVAKDNAEQAYATCRQAMLPHGGQLPASFPSGQRQVKWIGRTIPGVGVMPEVTILNLSRTQIWVSGMSSLQAQGYKAEAPGIVYDKECEIFSEAHHILEYFCGIQLVKYVMEFDYDSEGTMHPDIYEAWKASGGEDMSMSVAKYKAVKKWGVGFGGKKNADRAAKLALCVAMATTVPSAKLQEIKASFPKFGSLLSGGGL